MTRLPIVILLAVMCCACTEKPQTATARKDDQKPWDGAASAYAAPGYQGGNQAAWEQQMKSRNQSQNEYNRTTSR